MFALPLVTSLNTKKRKIGVWQPDDGARDGFSKKHIDSMLRDVGPLRAIFPFLNKKSKQNTIENKPFVNRRELFLMVGKAAKNYREKSLDVSIYDELSKFDRDIESEGSPTFLGDKRVDFGLDWRTTNEVERMFRYFCNNLQHIRLLLMIKKRLIYKSL